MMKILFVCHGNICRSPMAEFCFRDKVEKRGMGARFEVASAAVSSEELGNPVYPPARRCLNQHGIDCSGKYARQITTSDFEYYDRIIVMDNSNLSIIRSRWGREAEARCEKMMSFVSDSRKGKDVADPWYTGNFERSWSDINDACEALLDALS